MNQSSKDLAALAKQMATQIKTDLTSEDLTELLLLINYDWLSPQDKIRMATLLSQIDRCWDYAPIKISRLPKEIPFPSPFHTRENAPFLITKLRRAKSDVEKKVQLEEYLSAVSNGWTREEDILVQMIKQGPEDVVYFDAPDLVTHALITKKLKPRLLRILDGRDPKIQIEVICG